MNLCKDCQYFQKERNFTPYRCNHPENFTGPDTVYGEINYKYMTVSVVRDYLCKGNWFQPKPEPRKGILRRLYDSF